MCGRTVLAADADTIQTKLDCQIWHDRESYQPSYNVPPTRYQPVVMYEHKVDIHPNRNNESKSEFAKVLRNMKWGLTHSWASRQSKYRLQPFNVRDDSLFTNKAMFNKIKHTNRCLVVAQGFYEWKKQGRKKNPFFCQLPSNDLNEFDSNRFLYLGAIYNYTMVDDQPLYSYAIITTPANEEFRAIHNRMPLVFDPNKHQDVLDRWLNPDIGFNEYIEKCVSPFKDKLTTYQVSLLVNKTTNDEQQLVRNIHFQNNTKNIESDVSVNQSADPKQTSITQNDSGDELSNQNQKQKQNQKPIKSETNLGNAKTKIKRGRPKRKLNQSHVKTNKRRS